MGRMGDLIVGDGFINGIEGGGTKRGTKRTKDSLQD